jgi:hypothetical protein
MAYSLFLVFEDPALKCYSAVFTLGKKLSPALVNSPSRVRDRLVMDRECRICAGHFGVSVQCPQRSAVGASPTARPRRGGTALRAKKRPLHRKPGSIWSGARIVGKADYAVLPVRNGELLP